MKNENFEKALSFALKWEGGYVDHPQDPGGATNYGVTQRTYSAYLKAEGRTRNHVRNITKDEVKDIYYRYYWLPSKAGTATPALGWVMFDTAINFGIHGMFKLFQKAVDVQDDGVWGKDTQKVFESKNSKTTALALIAERRTHRYNRVKNLPSQRVFLKGWLNRDNSLEDFINNA